MVFKNAGLPEPLCLRGRRHLNSALIIALLADASTRVPQGEEAHTPSNDPYRAIQMRAPVCLRGRRHHVAQPGGMGAFEVRAPVCLRGRRHNIWRPDWL